jgi:hypothetical protein
MRPMCRVRISNEIRARPGKSYEKFGGEHVAFEAVAPAAGENDVAWGVRAAVRQRMDVVERREVELQSGGAIDAPPAAVSHGGVFYRALV